MLRFLQFLLFAGLFSCSGRYTPAEYVEHVNDNQDYTSTYKDKDHIVTCKYMPTNMLALQEMGNERLSPDEKKKIFLATKSNFNNSVYFILSLGYTDGSNVLTRDVTSQLDYSLRLNFLTHDMDKCFFIIKPEGDTLRASLYEYQRSYGNSPNATLIFAFQKEAIKISDQIEFYYKDRILGIPNLVRLQLKPDILKEDNIEISF